MVVHSPLLCAPPVLKINFESEPAAPGELIHVPLQHRTRTCSPWQWPNDPNHSFPRVQSLCSYFESSVATSQWTPAQLAGQAFLSLVHPSHILRQCHTLRFCQTTAGLDSLEKQLIYCSYSPSQSTWLIKYFQSRNLWKELFYKWI